MHSKFLSGLIVLFYLFYSVVCYYGSTCPGQAAPYLGERLYGSKLQSSNDLCETFAPINWGVYETYRQRGVTLFNYIGETFCSRFKEGKVIITRNEHFVNGRDRSWMRDVNWEYLLFNWFIIEFVMDDSWYHWGYMRNYRSAYFKTVDAHRIPQKPSYHQIKIKHKFASGYYIETFQEFPSEYSWMRGPLNDIDDMRNTFKQPAWDNPLCPFAKLQGGKIHLHVRFQYCSDLQKRNRNTIVKCEHQAYRDCIEHVYHRCTYHASLNKWYDRLWVIQKENELPYGKPCTNKTLAEIGAKPCNATCRGKWSAWSDEPDLVCGVYTRIRYQGIEEGEECKNKTICCPETKVHTATYRCEDFAFNTTTNLRLLGCGVGTLITGPTNHLMCECPPGWEGIQCERSLCKNACLNDGTCIAFVGGAVCLCPQGFEGDDCGTKSTTCGKSGLCQNGGTCIPTSDERGAYCKCVHGFGGLACESKADYCKIDSCHMRGACINVTDTFTFRCDCHEGFTGTRCETSVALAFDTADAVSGISTVAIVVLIILALFTFFTGGAVVHRRRKRRRMHGGGTETSSAYSVFSTIGSKMGYSTQTKPKPADKGVSALAKGGSQAVGLSMKANTKKN